MFIRNIEIYTYDPENNSESLELKLSQQAPTATRFSIFSPETISSVDDFCKANPVVNKIKPYKPKNLFHYIVKLAKPPIAIALESKTMIDNDVLIMLMTNIMLVHKHNHKINITLDDIIKNPNQYSTKEIPPPKDEKIVKIEKALDETKQVLLLNIDKMLDLRTQTDKVLEKSIHLEKDAKSFEKNARKVKGCCGW